MSFEEFDPLEAKLSPDEGGMTRVLRREIDNILDSYFGWYDPFSELIQNALDAVDTRKKLKEPDGYKPKILIEINIKENSLTVSDNGIGLTEEQFKKFLAPSFSFKEKYHRGHKGVGATYLAYGFNYISVVTKHPNFTGIGEMLNARKWMNNPSKFSAPKMVSIPQTSKNDLLPDFDRGVGVKIKFDKFSKPSKLSWIVADTAKQWSKILRLKTGLGAIEYKKKVQCEIRVTDSQGQISTVKLKKPSYLWPHKQVTKSMNLRKLQVKETQMFEKQGADFSMPATHKNIEAFYDNLEYQELDEIFELTDEQKQIVEENKISIYYAYFYTAKFFKKFNDSLGIRSGQSILSPGIQLAANKMPQGSINIIDLRRNIGRQNQMHLVCHLSGAKSDLGRKGFQEEIVSLVDDLSKKLISKDIQNLSKYLKATSGAPVSLLLKKKVADWKREFEKHEKSKPLVINNPLFFRPKKSVSVSSEPTREQDVIALFNQFLAVGVIRGIDILSTNERFTYDSMFRVVFGDDEKDYVFDKKKNPLGVHEDSFESDFISEPKILEYKFSLDAIIEDASNGTKNTNDIDLVVVWKTDDEYLGNYEITSLLDDENLADRQYHGVTHIVTNLTTKQHEFNLIVLEELVDYLNQPKKTLRKQREKYDP